MTLLTHSHKIIVALAEFENFVMIDSVHAVAVSDSKLQCSGANAASELSAVGPGAAADSKQLCWVDFHEFAMDVAAAAESAGDLFFVDSDDDSF